MFVQKIRKCLLVSSYYPSDSNNYIQYVYDIVKDIIINNLDVKLNVIIGSQSNYTFDNNYKVIRVDINYQDAMYSEYYNRIMKADIIVDYNKELISKDEEFLNKRIYIDKKVFNETSEKIKNELLTDNYNNLIKKLIEYKEPTFNVVITTIGRNCLLHMLRSLQPQLKKEDCLTVIYDGYEPNKEMYDIKFKCKVITIHQKENLGMKYLKMMYRATGEYPGVGIGGHAVKEAYKNELEKRDFIVHSDDDDEYLPGVFDELRRKCINKHYLYICNVALGFNKTDIIPRNKNVNAMFQIFDEGNISSQSGIVPYEINRKGIWGQKPSGDCEFYRSLFNSLAKIVTLDTLLYQFRPHRTFGELSVNYLLNNNKEYISSNYVTSHTKLLRDIRYSVKNMLHIRHDSKETDENFANSLKCWSEYFVYSKIYGLHCYQDKNLNSENIITCVGDPNKEEDLQKVMDNIGSKIELIIYDQNNNTNNYLFPFTFLHKFLKSGGMYIIQNIQADNIEILKDLSHFSDSFKEFIAKNFTIEYLDSSLDKDIEPNYIVAFKKN